jgi:flagellar motor switch protein FliG
MTAQITNAEKAVLFLLSLDEEVARPIVDELSEDDLKKLRTVASTMRVVPKDAVNRTFKEFLEKADMAVAVPRGGLGYLRRLSAGSIGEERARALFEEHGTTSPLAKLEAASPDDVAGLLAQEPPQLAAAVLSMMAPTSAAEILSTLEDQHKGPIVLQMGRMKQLPASVIEDVAAALAAQLPDADANTLVTVDGVAKAAELLNGTSKTAASAILEQLESEDPDLAQIIKQAMFTFDDLARLDSKAMRTLLREVATDRLTIALRGASDEVTQAIFGGLSSRAADLIRDDLANMGHVRKADVEAARREITDAALKLEEEGKLSLGREEE